MAIDNKLKAVYDKVALAIGTTNEFVTALPDCYDAVEAKGGTLPAQHTAANLPAAISSIPQGGADYSALSQIGFSNSAIQALETADDAWFAGCAPTADDIAAATPYVGQSGGGSRRISSAWAKLRYVPPYTVTNGSCWQFFYDMSCCEIFGGIIATTPIYDFRGFVNNSVAPKLRYILGDTIDLTNSGSGLSVYQAFMGCYNLISLPPLKIKCSSGDTIYRVFDNCVSLQSLDLTGSDTSLATDWYRVFYCCMALKEIKGVVDFSSATRFTYTFSCCYQLEDVHFKNIGLSVSLADCTKLSYDSLLYLVQNLQNVSGQTLTLGSTNIAKLNATADGQAAIATAQGYGWTIS